MPPQVLRTADFARDAARFILQTAHGALAERGLFRLALSGGSTPREVHEALAGLARDLPWDRVQITFGDERCVPPEHPESNYRMAKESLLDRVAVPAGNVFRIRGESDPGDAARAYEETLRAVADRFREPRYVHDLILLGLGSDGHTASLFPGSPALSETVRHVLPVTGPKPPVQRVTFTFPLINVARQVLFLVKDVDGSKRPIIDEIISGRSSLPAARVRPEAGGLAWIIGTTNRADAPPGH
ncbi:MAG: 6-phosphogluconolactonase [Verrucomicrobiota bacterium]|nr:6-phosphogluconolactonase [Verrucomicrobiota bacterium]